MPVRDALRQLRHEGLLEEDRGNHLRIASFDFESIRDVYAVKAAAHARATRRATERSTDAELASLLDIHREMVRAVDQGDSADVAVSNWSFHRRINVLARAPYLVATLRALPIRFDGSAFHADDFLAFQRTATEQLVNTRRRSTPFIGVQGSLVWFSRDHLVRAISLLGGRYRKARTGVIV